MADVIGFKRAFFNDAQIPKSLEDSIRLTGAYAGIHSYNMQDWITENFANLDDWVSCGGTFAISSSQLSATGGGGGDLWYVARHSTEVPPSFVASFDLVSGSGGFLFRGKETNLPKPCYIAFFNSDACGFLRLNDNTRAPTLLTSIPHGIPGPSRIQVHARWSLDSVDENRKWLEMSLYRDGDCRAAYSEDIYDTNFDWDGDFMGFAVNDSDAMVVDSLTVSALTRTVEWTIIDVGQSPGSGMARAIGTTRVAYICRYDGSLRVWRPGNRDLDWTSATGRQVRLDDRRNIGAPTHTRVQAAIHEADGFEGADGMTRMHRFVLHGDPNIMTEDEAFTEAARVSHDYRERAEITRIQHPPNYLLEPQDRISVDGVDYRIVAITDSVQMTGEGPRIAQTLECQRYYTSSV